MNEQEVIEIASAAYISGESDKFIQYSKDNKDFQFNVQRTSNDLDFSFVYRNWSTSYEADDHWCDMYRRFDEIESDLLQILGHDDLMNIIESIVGLVDPISDESFSTISDLMYDSCSYEDAYRNFTDNLIVYIFSLVACFSAPQIAIMDGLIEKTAKTVARLYGHMEYRYQLEDAPA